MLAVYPTIQLLGSRLIGMAPLFESGQMQVRSLPSQFCYYKSRLCSCSPTGRGCNFKNCVLLVQIQSGVPNFQLSFTCSCGGIGRRGRLKICSILIVSSSLTLSMNGMWRNLVARRLWEPKVAGSNPAIPTLPL